MFTHGGVVTQMSPKNIARSFRNVGMLQISASFCSTKVTLLNCRDSAQFSCDVPSFQGGQGGGQIGEAVLLHSHRLQAL